MIEIAGIVTLSELVFQDLRKRCVAHSTAMQYNAIQCNRL